MTNAARGLLFIAAISCCAPARAASDALGLRLSAEYAKKQAAQQAKQHRAAPKKVSSEKVESCIAEAGDYYNQFSYPAAEAKFRECLKMDPSNANAQISLAGVLLVQEKTDAAKAAFEKSVVLLPKNSPLLAYCHSRLGDIGMKAFRLEEARRNYEKALASDPRDINAVVGLGRYYEIKKDWHKAYALYRRGLDLEPYNIVAREGTKNAEVHTMTDGQILTEMKQRQAVPQDAKTLEEKDRRLFVELREAESMRAIDYMKDRMRLLPASYVVEYTPKDSFFRLLLTAEGYRAYKEMLTRDALAFFEKKSIPVKNIFGLNDQSGMPVFAHDGKLTYEGLQVYYYALIGDKKYLLPGEAAPKGAASSIAPEEKAVAEVLRDQFVEISPQELEWLEKATACSEKTFETELDLRTLPYKGGTRYFIDGSGSRKDRGMLNSYITRYRSGEATAKDGSLVGIGSIPLAKLCNPGGSLWNSD